VLPTCLLTFSHVEEKLMAQEEHKCLQPDAFCAKIVNAAGASSPHSSEEAYISPQNSGWI